MVKKDKSSVPRAVGEYLVTPDAERWLNSLVKDLESSGAKVDVGEFPASGSFGRKVTEKGVRLAGQDVDAICPAVLSRGSYGSVERGFHYKVVLDAQLAREARKALEARSKVIKEGKILGIFGGKVADVKWAGGRIADSLNHDTNLRRTLVHYARIGADQSIEIVPQESWVDIVCNVHFFNSVAFALEDAIEEGQDYEVQENEMLSTLPLFNNIAKRVRDVAGSEYSAAFH